LCCAPACRRYGPYTTAYYRFNRWLRRGVWKRTFDAKSRDSLYLIESTSSRHLNEMRIVSTRQNVVAVVGSITPEQNARALKILSRD
jgi:transposase